MLIKYRSRIIIPIIMGCAAIFAVLCTCNFSHADKEYETVPNERAITATEHKRTVLLKGWREDFARVSTIGDETVPEGWKLEVKPLTRPAIFSIDKNASGFQSLHMEADRASASLITMAEGVDLTKTPILRWRWRVTRLPQGADGRVKAKDDQAIGIYVGTGSALDNRSVSYRWDTETPKGARGDSAYGLGGIKVKWFTLRNKEDAAEGQWYEEERNIAEDFKDAWGFYPDKVYVSVSCNSQYTRSSAAADLQWIEFVLLSEY